MRILTIVLAVVLVLALASAVWMWSKQHAADEERSDRADATNVAQQFALRVDTFDGKDIDKYSKSVEGLLTTKYKAEFNKQFEPFKQVFTQAQATGTGKILVMGVGSYDADSATVLVAHDALGEVQAGRPGAPPALVRRPGEGQRQVARRRLQTGQLRGARR